MLARMEASAWQLAAGGRRLEAGGWRLETGGWRLKAVFKSDAPTAVPEAPF